MRKDLFHSNFYGDLNVQNPGLTVMELPTVDSLLHVEEFKIRSTFCLGVCSLVTILSLLNMEFVVHILQAPALGVKFMQLGPGEYLITSIKVALSIGFLFAAPFIFIQLFTYFLPAFTHFETKILVPFAIGSIGLFNFGMLFSYAFLLPSALQFFIAYGSKVIEPIWCFQQYFNFISVLLCTAGLSFQLPILQITLGILSIFSSRKMFEAWKHIIFICVALSAVLTPSTDPITQIIMAGALLTLYVGGCLIVLIIEKSKRVI